MAELVLTLWAIILIASVAAGYAVKAGETRRADDEGVHRAIRRELLHRGELRAWRGDR